MAVLTDLTWQQIADQLPANAIKLDASGKAVVDISVVTGTTADALTDMAVIKFFNVMFAAANKAQVAANSSQEDGEKLSAFAPATIGSSSNGFITLTRQFVCRSELATATNIIGSNV